MQTVQALRAFERKERRRKSRDMDKQRQRRKLGTRIESREEAQEKYRMIQDKKRQGRDRKKDQSRTDRTGGGHTQHRGRNAGKIPKGE